MDIDKIGYLNEKQVTKLMKTLNYRISVSRLRLKVKVNIQKCKREF
jgi:hypothetical protein